VVTGTERLKLSRECGQALPPRSCSNAASEFMSSTAATCAAGTALAAMLAIARSSLVMMRFVYSEEAWPFYFCCYDGCDIAHLTPAEATIRARGSGGGLVDAASWDDRRSGGGGATQSALRRLIEENGEQNLAERASAKNKIERWRR